MTPHPRIRKTIQWAGAAVTVVLVVVWIGSIQTTIKWQLTKALGVSVGRGRLSTCDVRDTVIGWWQMDTPGLHVLRNLPPELLWNFYRYDTSQSLEFAIPIWPVPAFTLLATIAAWRFDALARRRAKLNLCPNCGYDRTGLAPGAVCPECEAPPVS
jgi:hypothetical protein